MYEEGITNMAVFKFLIVLISTMIILSGCSSRDEHNHPTLTTGEELFNYHCEDCHGIDGTGKLLSSTPANIFTERDLRGIMHYITTDTGGDREMPVFSNMPTAEAEKIARHLLKLKKNYKQQSINHKKPEGLIITP